jgi:hypothetical protein
MSRTRGGWWGVWERYLSGVALHPNGWSFLN